MSTEPIDREAVECPLCWAQPGQACDFVDGPAPTVDDNGTRRAVHAARYAASLPPEERGPFWENAVDSYLSAELERMNAAATSACRSDCAEIPGYCTSGSGCLGTAAPSTSEETA